MFTTAVTAWEKGRQISGYRCFRAQARKASCLQRNIVTATRTGNLPPSGTTTRWTPGRTVTLSLNSPLRYVSCLSSDLLLSSLFFHITVACRKTEYVNLLFFTLSLLPICMHVKVRKTDLKLGFCKEINKKETVPSLLMYPSFGFKPQIIAPVSGGTLYCRGHSDLWRQRRIATHGPPA